MVQEFELLTEEEAIRWCGFGNRLAWAAFKRRAGLVRVPTRFGSRYLVADVERALETKRGERFYNPDAEVGV
jgi:hypothetical protein